MIRKIKFFIAKQLDKNPNLCWADLVMWAEGFHTFREAISGGQVCRKSKGESFDLHGYGWCGKCRKDK